LDGEIDGKHALSHVSKLSKNQEKTLLSVHIETGRKHQISPTQEGQRRAQVAYRHPFPNEEIRRVSEQTSPQVARAAGHPVRETSAD